MSVTTRNLMLDYRREGVSVIPLRLDGSKRPSVPTWKPYQFVPATAAEVWTWTLADVGIGIVCGVVSGGLEVMDFDHDADRVFADWLGKLPNSISSRLCVVETGGGGFHVPYRCKEICGNKKIAFPPDRSKPYIETRGDGGYIVGAGSPLSVHSSGQPYVQVMGRPLPEIPELSLEERKTLWKIARSFDESETLRDEIKTSRRRDVSFTGDLDPTKPWDDFDMRGEWAAVLEPHGWTSGDGIHWTRPGKRYGNSASVVTAKNGCEVLRVFTSSAPPLKAETTYGKTEAFKLLSHGGDASEAARALLAMGYGRAAA